MKMWRRMVTEIHPNQDAIEGADRWHLPMVATRSVDPCRRLQTTSSTASDTLKGLVCNGRARSRASSPSVGGDETAFEPNVRSPYPTTTWELASPDRIGSATRGWAPTMTGDEISNPAIPNARPDPQDRPRDQRAAVRG
jgi:hypothetical protein